MEQKQAANYDNLLLDNLNKSIPIDITASLYQLLRICFAIVLHHY